MRNRSKRLTIRSEVSSDVPGSAIASWSQQDEAQRGRDRQCDEQGSGRTRDERDAERAEKATLDAAEKEQRRKHQQDDGGRKHDRATDFLRGAVHDVESLSAFLRWQEGLFAQSPIDVLHEDNRVVDHAPDGDGEASEGHRVDRSAALFPKSLQRHANRRT